MLTIISFPYSYSYSTNNLVSRADVIGGIMNKVTLNIDGMMCGMCEAHINDTVRKIYPKAKKLSSSHKKGETTFILDGEPDEAKLKSAIAETGYEFKGIKTEPYVKKGLFR